MILSLAIDGYNLIGTEINWNGNDVPFYVRKNVWFNMKACLSSSIENIFTDPFIVFKNKNSFHGHYIQAS